MSRWRTTDDPASLNHRTARAQGRPAQRSGGRASGVGLAGLLLASVGVAIAQVRVATGTAQASATLIAPGRPTDLLASSAVTVVSANAQAVVADSGTPAVTAGATAAAGAGDRAAAPPATAPRPTTGDGTLRGDIVASVSVSAGNGAQPAPGESAARVTVAFN